MNNLLAKRSMPLILAVLGILILSFIVLYTRPTLSEPSGCDEYFEDCSGMTYADVTSVMEFYEKDWLVSLGRYGAAIVVLATLGFTTRYWLAQALAIATGAVAMLVPAIWIIKHREGFVLGDGLILYILCVIGMAIIPVVFYLGNVTSSKQAPTTPSENAATRSM